MKFEERDLVLGTASRLARFGPPPAATSKEEDLVAARRFLRDLSGGREFPPPTLDVLHAACVSLRAEPDTRLALSQSHDLFAFLVAGEPSPFAEEGADLQSACAFAGWRAARRLRDAAAAAHWVAKLTDLADSTTASLSVEAVLEGEADAAAVEARIVQEAMRTLLVCEWLRRRNDANPERVRAAAARLFALVGARSEGSDTEETAFFLGELALVAGMACRHLSRRAEAYEWLDRSEAHFRLAGNVEADVARVEYQRLAVRIEERDIRGVAEAAPALRETFRAFGMLEDELKCRLIEGVCLIEMDELPRAAETFRDVCADAERLGYEKWLASAQTDLVQVYGMMGDADRAIDVSSAAIPLLRRLHDRVALAKLQWGLGSLLREKGHFRSAVETFREARAELESLGMRADVAALSLVIADLWLELGEKAEALREISAAIPIIHELQMTQEGMAALSLLRESARGNEIDRAALRELYRSFREPEA